MLKKKLFFLIVGILPFIVEGQTDHWETIFYDSDIWKYHVGATTPGFGWNLQSFDASSWSDGQGGFGYGDGDDVTTVPAGTITIYLRMEFQVDDPAVIEEILLQADFDDAFIAYLNGTEIARSGFFGWTTEPAHDQPADQLREARMYQGGVPENFQFDKALLTSGTNLLAIQVHNQSSTSSDMSARFFMSAGINNTNTYFKTVPSWFVTPVNFTSSNLPIIVIETNGQNIPNDPRIVADMGIIYNGPGQRNNLIDTHNEYSGRISIEKRGSSSQGFPKNNYRIETQDALGLNNNVPLLGMPQENDWVLHGPYTDKSLMRNVLTFHIGEKLGYYVPRTQFAELVLNDEYWGVYVLMETIKRDSNRVDISNLRTTDVSGDEVTGGYILKVDRPDPEGGYWQSNYKNNGSSHGYQVVYPKPDEIMPEQMNYIQKFMYDFETELWNYETDDPFTGFPAMADEMSFVDFFLVNELSRNVDAYRLSSFLYKEKITKGGKLVAGPLWDFNLAFGNANYCESWEYSGWAYSGNCDGGVPFYWKRLMGSKRFIKNIQERWTTLRQNELSIPEIHGYIDSVAAVLEEAQQRNFVKWPVLGTYVWPNVFIGDTYQQEVDYLKGWVEGRFLALDFQIQNLEPSYDYNYLKNFNTQIYPNPFSNSLNLQYALYEPGPVEVSILNSLGQEVYYADLGNQPLGIYEYQWEGLDKWGDDIGQGLYLMVLKHKGQVKHNRKVVRR